MRESWRIPGTWILFFAYAAVPVALYWLLDRTGAVSDTSVFAAILIGFGYQGIISGGNQSIRAPGDVSGLWTPFVAYADTVAKRALERGARNQLRLAEEIIVEIMKDRSRYDALQALALDRTSDIAAQRTALDEIDNAPSLGEGQKLEKKARYLYGLLLSVPDVEYLLQSKKVVGKYFYLMKRLPLLLLIALAALVVALSLGSVFLTGNPEDRGYAVRYYVWRLGKTNSSAVDQYRSRRGLVTVMNESPKLRRRAVDALIYLLQRPGLPLERVDLALRTLLETHPTSPSNDLPPRLVQALRAEGLDARTRIHDALVFLTASCASKPEPGLKEWKPTERDSSTALEEKIVSWSAYWVSGCAKK